MHDVERNNTDAGHGRAIDRVKLKGRAYLAVAGDAGQLPCEVDLQDLSFNGAGLVAPVNLKPGTPVVLLLHPVNHSTGSLRGHVLNSHRIAPDAFRLGLEFDAGDGPTIKSIKHAFFPDDVVE